MGTASTGRLARAVAMAANAHADQLDKAGEPYVLHVLSVMFRVRGMDASEDAQIVAVLHDTLEDTDLTACEIWEAFGVAVASSVETLTRLSSEAYEDYIQRIKNDPLAVVVKIADLEDNIDPKRHAWVKDEQTRTNLLRLQGRYERALQTLRAMDSSALNHVEIRRENE